MPFHSFGVVLTLLTAAAFAIGTNRPQPVQHRRQASSITSTATQPSGATATVTTSTATNLTTSVIVNPAEPSKTATLLLDPARVSILDPLPNKGWTGQCLAAVLYDYAGATDKTAFGFVDGQGLRTHRDLDGDTWGVDYARCKASCAELGINFDFSNFANSATNYLLPWLALCAQLPYENGNWVHGLMSVLLALGSPALAVYSLSLSMLSVLRLRNLFDALVVQAGQHTADGSQLRRLKTILLQALQEPIVLWRKTNSVGTLIFDPRTASSWDAIANATKGSRRGLTLSLFAQMTVAAIAFLFTVIASLQVNLGDEGTMLQISNGGLWLWLLPVVLGFVCLRNQSSANALHTAFRKAAEARSRQSHLANSPSGHTSTSIQKSPQIFVIPRSAASSTPTSTDAGPGSPGLLQRPPDSPTPSSSRSRSPPVHTNTRNSNGSIIQLGSMPTGLARNEHSTNEQRPRPAGDARPSSRHSNTSTHSEGHDDAIQPDHLEPLPRQTSMALHESIFAYNQWREWMCYDFGGDALWQGAMFNYARFIRFDETITAIETTLKRRLNAGNGVNTTHTEAFDGPEAPELLKRTCRRPLTMKARFKIIGAALLAIFVLWGTAGASIIVAYKTQTRGLGCRSGSYLLYAIIATIAFVLLGSSEILSHHGGLALTQWKAMDRRLYPTDGRGTSDGSQAQRPSLSSTYRSSTHATSLALQRTNTYTPRTLPDSDASLRRLETRHRRFLIASTLVQVAGRFLAVFNACWLLTIAILEPVGVYNNCYCQGTVLELGQNGWVVLFKQAKDLALQAEAPTGGGVALGIITCVGAGFVFLLGALSHQRGA